MNPEKKKRYWLRGGVVFLALFVLLVTLTIRGTGHPPAIIIPLIPPAYILSLFSIDLFSMYDESGPFVVLLISAAIYLLSGVLIGWFYGKAKQLIKTKKGVVGLFY